MPSNDEPIDGGDGGSDSEPASVSGISLGPYLSDSEKLSGVNFKSASGVNYVAVARAAIATVAFAIAYGVTSVVDAVSQAVARIIDGVSDFVADGLIASTVGVGESAIRGAWAFSLAEFGVLALPLALITALATFYAANWGINTAQEVLR